MFLGFDGVWSWGHIPHIVPVLGPLGGQLPHTYLLDPTSAFTPHPHLSLFNFKKPSLTRTISLLIRVGVVLIAKRLLEQQL